MKKKIFLSYARADRPFARRLVEHLKSVGPSGWMDDADISSGSNISDHIRSALKESSALVVLVSAESRDSQWVNFEVGAGVAMGVPVIPVILDGENLEIPETLRDIPVVDARNRPIEEVVNNIEKRIE